jgi:urease gamma subunit
MNELKVKEILISVLNAINSIPVSGNNVYTMAGIMNTIHELVNEIDVESKNENGGDK